MSIINWRAVAPATSGGAGSNASGGARNRLSTWRRPERRLTGACLICQLTTNLPCFSNAVLEMCPESASGSLPLGAAGFCTIKHWPAAGRLRNASQILAGRPPDHVMGPRSGPRHCACAGFFDLAGAQLFASLFGPRHDYNVPRSVSVESAQQVPAEIGQTWLLAPMELRWPFFIFRSP